MQTFWGIVIGVLGTLALVGLGSRLLVYRVFAPFESALILRRGRLLRRVRGGTAWLLGPLDRVLEVDTREHTEPVPSQEILSTDGVQVKVTALATYRVADEEKALLSVADYRWTLYAEVQTALRDAAAARTAEDLVRARDDLGDAVTAAVEPAAERLGLALAHVRIRDVMLPGEWKQANVEVIKARQEGLAALERARGETAALRALANAARALDDNPSLVHLRVLHTVAQIGERGGNTFVVGVPETALNGVLARSGAPPAESTDRDPRKTAQAKRKTSSRTKTKK